MTRKRAVTLGIAGLVAALIALTPSTAGAQQCYPPCRAGYFCNYGRCISACNPPCPAGYACTADYQCLPMSGPQVMVVPVAPQLQGPGDPGWAVGAGIWGIVNAVLAVGAATGTLFIDDEVATGATAMAVLGYLGATTPLIVVGGNSATGRSVTALEVLGWITYGLGMSGGLALAGLNLAGSGPDDEGSVWYYLPFGLLALSNAFFAGDALVSAGRSHARAQGPFVPSLAVAPTPDGGASVLLGVGGPL